MEILVIAAKLKNYHIEILKFIELSMDFVYKEEILQEMMDLGEYQFMEKLLMTKIFKEDMLMQEF